VQWESEAREASRGLVTMKAVRVEEQVVRVERQAVLVGGRL